MRAPADPRAEVDALWEAYAADASAEARDALIVHYSPLVRYVAGRVAAGLPPNVEQGDLNSYGVFGLIDAIDKFDPRRGNKFETYAMARIRGAILDELRSVDWVPRSVRVKSRRVESAMAALEARHDRAGTDDELADELGWSADQLRDALGQISRVGLAALDDVRGVDAEGGEVITLGDTIEDRTAFGPMGAFDMAETRQLLGEAMAAVPERERLVLTLYYFEGLTLLEIGDVLGVTESRACQLHGKALVHLRRHLRAGQPIRPT
jgi:RNA polymerase sigma factor for flagellar operon FliA